MRLRVAFTLVAAVAAVAGGGPDNDYEEQCAPAAGEALGVLVSPLPPSTAAAVGMTDTEGVLIRRVVPGSPAAEAGLQPGDIVLAVDGQRVDGPQAFRHVIDTQEDELVGLRVVRGSERLDLSSALASYDELALTREPIPDDARWRRSLQGSDTAGDVDSCSEAAVPPGGRQAAGKHPTQMIPAAGTPAGAVAGGLPAPAPAATLPPPSPAMWSWRLTIDLSSSEEP